MLINTTGTNEGFIQLSLHLSDDNYHGQEESQMMKFKKEISVTWIKTTSFRQVK
jgi:hypothetical protein